MVTELVSETIKHIDQDDRSEVSISTPKNGTIIENDIELFENRGLAKAAAMGPGDTQSDPIVVKFPTYLKRMLKKGDYMSSATLPLGPMTYPRSIEDPSKVSQLFNQCDSTKENLLTLCQILQRDGISLTKITRKKKRVYIFKLDADYSLLTWKLQTRGLELDSVKDVRVGSMADNYQDEYNIPSNLRKLWVTIIYTSAGRLKALHLVADNKINFDLFVNCILRLIRLRKGLMESILLPDNERFAIMHWRSIVSERKEDESKDTLTFADVSRLCDKFHIYCSKDHLYALFNEADVNNNKLLNFKEFQTFVELLKERAEVTKLWKSSMENPDSSGMTVKDFYKFLVEIQGESELSFSACQKMFDEIRAADKCTLGIKEFTRYLNNQEYLIRIGNDNVSYYSKPLNHYFISSSHNTYLLGKQIAEAPSVEGYIQVLQQGCRCIEIDIWDDESGPVVCHGALTSAIPLINVVDVIRKYAFMSSPFPLIISLEIHCNKENQIKTTNILKSAFGDLLYTGSEKNDSIHEELPSPWELRHRIILKAKKSKDVGTIRDCKSTGNLANSSTSSSHFQKSLSTSTTGYTSSPLSSSNEHDIENNSSTCGLSEQSTNNVKSNSSSFKKMRRIRRFSVLKKRVHVIKELLDASGIHGLKFRNISLPESKTHDHCFSFNEKKFDVLRSDRTNVLSLDKHNRRYLMRVYPHAFRYKSSNFRPIAFWKLGVQMVATNWQTNDLGQQINLAMFQLMNQKNEISHAGYVLKPKSLVSVIPKVKNIEKMYDSLNEKAMKNPIRVTVKILSGQLLPNTQRNRDIGDGVQFSTYVTLRFINCDSSEVIKPIHDIENGYKLSPTEVSTTIVKDNGFNPIWETRATITLKSTDFTFLHFVVKSGDTVLAQSCIRLQYLRRGYRCIPLYNADGEQYIFSTLFIYSKISRE